MDAGLGHLAPTSRGFLGLLIPVLALLAHFGRTHARAPIKSWRAIHKLDNANKVAICPAFFFSPR